MKALIVLVAAIVIPGGFIILAASYAGRQLAKRRVQAVTCID